MLGLKVALVAGAVSGANATVTYTDTAGTCGACPTDSTLAIATQVSTCAATEACSTDCKKAAKSKALDEVVDTTASEFCIEGAPIMEINATNTPVKCKKGTTKVAAGLSTGNACNDHYVCDKTETCVGANSPHNAAALKGGTGTGSCTALTMKEATNVLNASAAFPAQEYSTASCAAGQYAGANSVTADATKCNAPKATAAVDDKCITEKADGTGSNCAAANYCDGSLGTHISRQDGKTRYAGVCKAKLTAAGGTGVTQEGKCKTGHKLIGTVCVDLETTANAVKHLEATAQKTCKDALDAFQKVQGGGLDWKKAVPAFKGNCAQITYDATKTQLEAFTIVHPPTQPGTAATKSAHPQCGFCSEECVTAAREAQEGCKTLATKYTYYTVLPIFEAINQYVQSTTQDILVKGTDPCALAAGTTGCGASDYRTADTKDAVTTKTGKLDTDAKINTWVGTCAVAYGSGGAGAQFASSFAVLALSALAIFA